LGGRGRRKQRGELWAGRQRALRRSAGRPRERGALRGREARMGGEETKEKAADSERGGVGFRASHWRRRRTATTTRPASALRKLSFSSEFAEALLGFEFFEFSRTH